MCRVIFADVFQVGTQGLHVTKRQLTSDVISTGRSSRFLTLPTLLLPAISLPLGNTVEAWSIAPMESGLGVAIRAILRGSILVGSTGFLGR